MNRDIHREIFIFKEDGAGGTALERVRYSELSGKYKSQIRACEGRRLVSFAVFCGVLVTSFIISFKAFSVLMAGAFLFTGYDLLDRRVRALWLKREYNRKRPDAEIEPSGRGKTD
jgi:hypothetical protein